MGIFENWRRRRHKHKHHRHHNERQLFYFYLVDVFIHSLTIKKGKMDVTLKHSDLAKDPKAVVNADGTITIKGHMGPTDDSNVEEPFQEGSEKYTSSDESVAIVEEDPTDAKSCNITLQKKSGLVSVTAAIDTNPDAEADDEISETININYIYDVVDTKVNFVLDVTPTA